MSQEERDELNWLKQARDGNITQREAAERIGVSERWVRKLLSLYCCNRVLAAGTHQTLLRARGDLPVTSVVYGNVGNSFVGSRPFVVRLYCCTDVRGGV